MLSAAKFGGKKYIQSSFNQSSASQRLMQYNARFFAGFGKPVNETSIGVPAETFENERRVAMSPEAAARLIKEGFQINVESGAGVSSDFQDADFEKVGAKIVSSAYDSDIVFKVRPPSEQEADKLQDGSGLLSFIYPAKNDALVE